MSVNPELERYSKTILKVLIFFVGMITLFFAVTYFIPMTLNVLSFLVKGFLPFLFAVVLAVLIDPLVDWLEQKKGIKRGYAVTFVLFLLVIFISLFMVFVISRLVIELSALYKEIPLYTQDWYGTILNAVEGIRNYLTNNPLPLEAQEALRNSMNTLVDQTAGIIAKTTNFLFNLLTGLPGFVTILIVSALATFFISRDKAQVAHFFYQLVPKKHVKPVSSVVGHINSALVGFFRAETILISITAMLTITGLYLIGVDYALTVGIIVGLLDLLPILGPGAFFIPWAIIAFISGRISFGVALLIIYGIVSTVRQLIEPKILSQSIGLNPLATLVAIYVGLQFFGVAGIIIGPFVFILVKGILKGWHQEY